MTALITLTAIAFSCGFLAGSAWQCWRNHKPYRDEYSGWCE